MANVFLQEKRRPSALGGLVLPVLFFAALIWLLTMGLNNLSKTTETERLKSAEQALRRAAVQCYALEGQYPPSLEYLEQNYGLMLDRDQYVYHYQGIGANLMPQIAVFSTGQPQQQSGN